MKSSLWTFANIASTVCVSDDAVSQISRHRLFILMSIVMREDPPLARGL